jgi:hypothetical protein
VTLAKSDRSYKRSWKNLLLNKRYQLRFTLFMVGLAALLMAGLGIWVMRVANETTTVAKGSVHGEPCPEVQPSDQGTRKEEDDGVPAPSMKLDEPVVPTDSPSPPAAPSEPAPEPSPSDTPSSPAAPSPGAPAAPATPSDTAASDDRRRGNVQIVESQMTVVPVDPIPPPGGAPPSPSAVPTDLAERIAAHWTCRFDQAARLARLERGRLRILWAMIGTGVVLVLGLAAYGLKMTHRVAGPLFKVSLYLGKMRAGRFDKVYNLRKGDQLVDFYEHFKLAHGGIVTMQRDDITRIAAVIAAAEAAGMGATPAVAELRALLERKEKSIE